MREMLSGSWLLVALGFGGEASAGIVHVPGDHSTLQAAVNAASPGDVVLVAAGTYRGAGNRDIDFGGKGLTVKGEAGARSTVIDCEGRGRAFRFPPDEPAGALLAGFTLRGGSAGQGGAIHLGARAAPTIEDCIFEANSALTGGSVFGDEAAPGLRGCTFLGNSAIEGGALAFDRSLVTLTNCVLHGNTAKQTGGALFWWGSNIALRDCSVVGNHATEGGGLFYHSYEGSSLRIEDCSLAENSARDGGAIYASGSQTDARVQRTTITGNVAAYGSALTYVSSGPGGTLELVSSILWGNVGLPLRITASAFGASYSCIEGSEVLSGPGNINQDPGFCGWAGAAEVYVDAANPEVGDGSATNPYSTLRQGLAYSLALAAGSPCLGTGEGGVDMGAGAQGCHQAGPERRLVHLAAGTYEIGGSTLTHHASLRGKSQAESVVRGTVFGLRTGSSLSRITVTGGTASGVHLNTGEVPEILDTTVTGNTSDYFGGGIFCENSSPIITRVTMTQNIGGLAGEGSGGGMHCGSGSPVLTDCRIAGNVARGGTGGGLSLFDSSPELRGCAITGNTAESGGGLSAYNSSPRLVNCLLTGNSATATEFPVWGGGAVASVDSSAPVLVNCTLAQNSALYGGGLHSLGSRSSPELINSIVWDNAGGSVFAHDGSTPHVTYSCLEGPDVAAGEGNINADPRFLADGHRDDGGTPEDPRDDAWVDGDYRLELDSPAIDVGLLAGAPPTDHDGFGRPCGGGVDMGAYERGACPVPLVFRRGLANADDVVDIADPIFIIVALFQDVPLPECLKSADSNDSGAVDISDPVHLLNYLFLGGPEPQAPFRACGPDPTGDALTCQTQSACPS